MTIRALRFAILLASCAAAALFVAVAVLLVRSAWITDQATHVAVVQPGDPERWRAYKARSHRGRLFFSALECDDDAGIYDRSYLGWRVISERSLRIGIPKGRNALERIGFSFGREAGPPVNPWWQRFVYVPHWLVLAVLGMLSTPMVRRVHHAVRARRRAARGWCPACGYDLRATPGQCPECGPAAAHAA